MVNMSEKFKWKMNKGFTLIEIVLVIALMGIVLGFGLSLLPGQTARGDLDVAVRMGVYELRRAQARAGSGIDDDSWGVYLSDGLLTLYRGSTYATRVEGYDEITVVPARVAWSGNMDFVFTPPYGRPSASGTTTGSVGGVDVNIYVTEYGSVYAQ